MMPNLVSTVGGACRQLRALGPGDLLILVRDAWLHHAQNMRT